MMGGMAKNGLTLSGAAIVAVLVVLAAFGAGLTWGANLIRW